MGNREPYATETVAIRDDLANAHHDALRHIASPGTWWTSKQRLAIAAETRNARHCALCQTQKDALSPNSVKGTHNAVADLSPAIVEVIHRIVNDPARLTQSWYRGVLASGVTDTEYVEAVSIIVHVISLDTFAMALGLAHLPLLALRDGNPSRRRPDGARQGQAWVPWIESASQLPAEDADIYPHDRPAPHIMRAMSLVPSEARSFFKLGAAQYMAPNQMRDFSREYRAITHAQIELLAGRISALNQCLY